MSISDPEEISILGVSETGYRDIYILIGFGGVARHGACFGLKGEVLDQLILLKVHDILAQIQEKSFNFRVLIITF
jgi:hypothetical protein